MRYSLNITVNYPDNTEKDISDKAILTHELLVYQISKLIREEPDASSFVIVIGKVQD